MNEFFFREIELMLLKCKHEGKAVDDAMVYLKSLVDDEVERDSERRKKRMAELNESFEKLKIDPREWADYCKIAGVYE